MTNKKLWYKGWDLKKRWSISEDDLLQYLLDGDIIAYQNITSKPYSKEEIKILVQDYDENSWAYIDTGGPWGLRYRVDNVLEFEKKHNITVDLEEDKNKSKTEVEEKKLLPHQEARIKCREVAEKLREQNPPITIADAIKHKNMKEVSKKKDGSFYSDKTIRDWIKDLWPPEMRKPGRRKGT